MTFDKYCELNSSCRIELNAGVIQIDFKLKITVQHCRPINPL